MNKKRIKKLDNKSFIIKIRAYICAAFGKSRATKETRSLSSVGRATPF